MPSLLLPFSAWLSRGLALLWLALAPYAAKVEVAQARSLSEAAVSLALVAAVFGALGYGVVRLAARHRIAAGLVALALVEALVLGGVFSGARAPLGRGFAALFPVVWGALALTAAGPLAELAARRQGRNAPERVARLGWAVATVCFGLLGLAASYRRIGSEDALLNAALQSDPGNERLALRLAAEQGQRGEARAREQTLRSCVLANAEACACALPLVEAALKRAVYADAASVLLHAAPGCRERTPAPGMLAEALAGGGEASAARTAAALALAKDPNDPHALYAEALLALRDADSLLARRLLERAVAAGRGGRARVDLGALLFKGGDLAGARRLFDAALREDPSDVAALFDLALVDQAENRYHFAREGYLKVLRLEPRQLDARYNLAVLTNAAGARAEAEHHVAEFEKAAPRGDTRVAALRRLNAN
jgi:tetratricopeptide (TPR) repeat protein